MAYDPATHEMLVREMPNGAAVIDWLGTAACSARLAANHIESARGGVHRASEYLGHAEAALAQALEELRAVQAEVGRYD